MDKLTEMVVTGVVVPGGPTKDGELFIQLEAKDNRKECFVINRRCAVDLCDKVSRAFEFSCRNDDINDSGFW